MVQIRAYRPTDLSAIFEITAEAFDGVSIDQAIANAWGLPRSADWTDLKNRAVEQDTVRDPEGVWVAEDNGRVVGYLTSWIDDQARVGYVPNMAVAASHRGRGIGRRLLDRVLEHFRAQHVGIARIETLEQNEVGRHLYPSLGFREVARQIHYAMPLEGDVSSTERHKPE